MEKSVAWKLLSFTSVGIKLAKESVGLSILAGDSKVARFGLDPCTGPIFMARPRPLIF